ncbi:PCI-domain-containing protein [Sanghuangporus baumii]|uniref:PCI-domain-containing protein n=1 Tax=Sanghuangporus baumii TaxID=108892 RepID=A0A9Q5HYI3_SANBA|nr:PCI-domain-containing protein [Sanghuangporus baumii]
MAAVALDKMLAEARAVCSTDPKRAEDLYRRILETSAQAQGSQAERESNLRVQESALVSLGELYRDNKDANGLAQVIVLSRSFMSSTAKAKTAKLIRTLLDFFTPIPNSKGTLMDVLHENIEWARSEKRIFLKHSLETRLVGIQLETLKYKEALALIGTLLTELKRLDDKLVLTEVHLLESRVYRATGNLPKSKAALTSARTAANSIYCPPYLQAQLDLQSGILHAEDKDYTTAYSYFYETFENLSSQVESNEGSGKALTPLKYILLCKIMLNLPEDVTALLSIKLAQKYADLREVECMRAIARAHKNRNLADFERVLREYHQGLFPFLPHYVISLLNPITELSSDPTIRTHLATLYDTLLEQNLLRIIEPYSIVDVEYVAAQVGQSRQEVELKISKMILDKVFHGVLDQGRGCLLVFDETKSDGTYKAAIQTIEEVGKVVESLFEKATKIA